MPILAATNIRHTYGDDIILDGCSLSVEPGERIGIVGRNGCGKSTLMRIMAGLMQADSGTVFLQRGCRASYLHQDPKLDPEETLRESAEGVFAELHELHRKLHDVFESMATAQGTALDRLLKDQENLERRIELAGGYAIDHKIGEVLHGLGFTDAQFTVPVKSLSGGQKGRLALARLLLENPDVAILDEPTNHLDLAGRLWLEEFLTREYNGAVVMVSHDRRMLDEVVNRIVEVEHGRLIEYPGNYAKFRELRAERRLTQARAYEKQQGHWKKEEEFIRRYKAGQRAKQAQGRLARLERAKSDDALERPMELATLNFDLPTAERSGDMVASVRGASKKYTGETGEKVLFRELEMVIGRGERWAIIGPNGAGKTTLVRCMLGECEVDSGAVRMGANLKIGFYRQSHEHLNADLRVYEQLQRVIQKEVPGTSFSEQAARNLAGAFLFSGDEQDKFLRDLSGGERSRVVLAGLLASAKNLLVLDEPTNHLDIPAAERLEEALSPPPGGSYEGTLILISHDRAFIDATCDHLLVLDGKGGCEVFTGTYSEWHAKDEARKGEAKRAAAEAQRARDDAEKKRRAAEAEKQKAKAPPAREPGNPLAKLKTEQLEEKIQKIEARVRAIDESLNDAEVWKNPAKCSQLGEERAKLVRELEPLEYEWMRRGES